MHHLEDLNERQKEAVLHTEGPLLIVAGAGAGKTRVITRRILHLIKKEVPPESILAITFTNKAAKEMRDRVAHLLHESMVNGQWSKVGSGLPWIGTFHALGAHIIRENSRRLGIPQRFKIYDKGDSLAAVKEAIRRTERDPKEIDPGGILSVISKEKGNMITMNEFRERASGEYFPGIVAEVWDEYEKILRAENALDFDDLLLRTTLLLQKEKRVREQYQKRWQFIHIDEYQDTNRVQYMLAKLLAEAHKNIAVVGDGDQLIYGWRGASIKNILHFEKDYPAAKVVLLEENYRSTQTILSVANHIILKNKLRRERTLFTKNAEGEKLGLCTAYDEGEEAAFVALTAKELIARGVEPREIAVLFRANFQSRALEEAFLAADVPYQVLGVRFFERKEVKDVLAYVRAASLFKSDLHGMGGLGDVRRIINVPPRGIGKVTLLKIFAGKENELPPAMRERIAAFRALLSQLKQKLETEPLSATLRWIVAASGLEAELKNGGQDDEERLENIKELVTFAVRYDAEPDREAAVSQFLADVALQSDQDELKEEKNAVRLMTVHASKGLEFEYVFITGLEQDLFPHARLDEDELTQEKAEEERRLFYVALTRAKKKVFLSYAGIRTIFGARQVSVPSEFIFDIPEEYLEQEHVTCNM